MHTCIIWYSAQLLSVICSCTYTCTTCMCMYIYTFSRGMLKSGSPIELLNNFACLILPPLSVNRLWSSRKHCTDLVGRLPLSSSGILRSAWVIRRQRQQCFPAYMCMYIYMYQQKYVQSADHLLLKGRISVLRTRSPQI